MDPRKKVTTHAGARIDAELHRQLLRQLFDEGRSFREWLEQMEELYLRTSRAQNAP